MKFYSRIGNFKLQISPKKSAKFEDGCFETDNMDEIEAICNSFAFKDGLIRGVPEQPEVTPEIIEQVKKQAVAKRKTVKRKKRE